jgi:XTP/dITP diphosphohydrolase
MKLIFVTNNINKVREIHHGIHNKIKLLTLKDIGFLGDIPEMSETIEGNAIQKALFIYNRYNIDCFADDTGLEIEALQGKPGVMSARYAGEGCNFEDNIKKVLNEMQHFSNRKASFKTVIALVHNGRLKLFDGIIGGEILREKRGEQGFGYDPIFKPNGLNYSFAEISLEEKNKISHRAIAFAKLTDYLLPYLQ